MPVAENLAVGGVQFPEWLETSHPGDIMRWAADRFGIDQLVVTASFKDGVLAHVAAAALPGIEIVMLDTQYLFAETLWFAEEMRKRFDLNLKVVQPLPRVQADNLWQTNADACCRRARWSHCDECCRTSEPGLPGCDVPTAPAARVCALRHTTSVNSVVKVNPLAAMSDEDIALYRRLHDLPENPLASRGYPSIGCWPCTRPVTSGEDRRAGRWEGTDKTECGLHL